MKDLTSLLTILLISFSLVESHAQEFDSELVKSEISKATEAEQNAFKSGDCEGVLDLMDDEITFLANGRRIPSKSVIGKFCSSIPRPFKTPILDHQEIYPISESIGYVIRNLEYRVDEKTKVSEYVTKIWKKFDGKWRITHLHSTVKEIPIN